MLHELTIILFLVLINGTFAMAEMAVVTARHSRLKAKADAGSRPARAALQLAKGHSQVLSTVQIGITLIGIVAGVYGGATLADDIEALMQQYLPFVGQYAHPISYACVVVFITFITLIFGELVPKQLALSFPEAITIAVTPLLRLTLLVFKPFVLLLDTSTKAVLKVMPLHFPSVHPVTDEDVRSLIREGAEQGTIETEESRIVSRTLNLGDRPVESIMTPRVDLVKLYLDDTPEDIWKKAVSEPHSYFPAFRSNSDDFAGIIAVRDLAVWQCNPQRSTIDSLLKEPSVLPASMSVLDALRTFRREKRHIAVIVDEHGSIDGLVTTHDLLEAMVGDLSDKPKEEPLIMQRDDGSLLVDAWLDVNELADRLNVPHETFCGDRRFSSVGGLIIWKMSGLPSEGDTVSIGGYSFEVVDMDRHRVDKVLITKEKKEEEHSTLF